MPSYIPLFNEIPVPPLEVETRKSKRNLLVSSFILYSVLFLDITISKITAVNAELCANQSSRVIYLIIFVVVYELIMFLVRFYTDYSKWYSKDIAAKTFERYSSKFSIGDKKYLFIMDYVKSKIFGLTHMTYPLNSIDGLLADIDFEPIAKQKMTEFLPFWGSHRNRMISFWTIDFLLPTLAALFVIVISIDKYYLHWLPVAFF